MSHTLWELTYMTALVDSLLSLLYCEASFFRTASALEDVVVSAKSLRQRTLTVVSACECQDSGTTPNLPPLGHEAIKTMLWLQDLQWLSPEIWRSQVTTVPGSHESNQGQRAPKRIRHNATHYPPSPIFFMYKFLKCRAWNGSFVQSKVLQRTVA